MSKSKYNPNPLIPRVDIRLQDGEPYTIGGLDRNSIIDEINFRTQLNSFAMKADVTIIDIDNRILNLANEYNGIKVTISLYEPPDVHKWNEELTTDCAVKVFQKTFNLDSIDVLRFNTTNYPYNSVIKLKLIDTFSTNALNKLLSFSNFNLKWDEAGMEVDSMIHRILRRYEDLKYVGSMVIPDIFGVDKNKLKRRFVTDSNTTIEQALFKYIDSLYSTRWYEFLSNDQPEPEIPQCLLAFGNQYTLLNGVLRNRPYLTSMNMLDVDPNKNVFSIPYPKSGKILDYAHKDYDIEVEYTTMDLRGGPSAAIRQKDVSIIYKRTVFNPHNGLFESLPVFIDRIYQMNPKVDFDIESQQKPKYLGVGDDPKFVQTGMYNKKLLINFPINVKENKHYISNGENSFYQDMLEVWSKPMLFVTLPNSAWHSPGQEIDLRMTVENYDTMPDKPEKEQFFSVNKLISGRWKIINSVTNFKQPTVNSNSSGIVPMETLGLVRMKYLSGENKE